MRYHRNLTNNFNKINKHVKEEDVFYTLPPPDDAKQYLKKFKQNLSSDELQVLNEIVEIQRKIDPAYGY